MKTERTRLKRVTTQRRLQFLFVNRRRPHCSREFRRRTLLNSLLSKVSLTPWQMVPRRLLRLELTAALASRCAERFDGAEAAGITRARHRSALTECRERLGGALTATLPELAAEELRLAARGLGRITGRVDVEDLLDVIFRDFCIGK